LAALQTRARSAKGDRLLPIGEGAYQSAEAVKQRTVDHRMHCEDGDWSGCFKNKGDLLDGHSYGNLKSKVAAAPAAADAADDAREESKNESKSDDNPFKIPLKVPVEMYRHSGASKLDTTGLFVAAALAALAGRQA